MGLIVWLVVGAIAGFLASLVMRSPHGVIMDIILGIIGAFVGGLIMNLFGQSGPGGFDIYSILVATLGAIVVIAIHRMFVRRAY